MCCFRLVPVLLLGVIALPALALTVETDFEGASVQVVRVDDAEQKVVFMPGGDPKRGWPCWWYFRVTGVDATRPLVLEIHASDQPMPQANGVPSSKPLAGEWSMPLRASFSVDGTAWNHTAPGVRSGEAMVYTLPAVKGSVLVAWGPPYLPGTAARFVREVAGSSTAAEERELCKSGEGRSVPMLRICEGDRVEARRFGIWVQARQHAWESGSSWVCQGLAEWMVGSTTEASWLRQNAEIYVVPIMDVDNTATGNGGKEALPRDHNRDWSEKPNWKEVAAAQAHIREFAREGRMDVFLDLHNPAPRDLKAFFYALPPDLVKEPGLTNRTRLFGLVKASVGEFFPMLAEPKYDGPKYHPLWRQMSGTWVTFNGNPQTVAVCLETPWNTELSTVAGYKEVGARLGIAVVRYLSER